MNLYHCMIELKSGAPALAFSSAADHWLSRLKARGLIRDWRLYRRKFGLASGSHTDFILEIEVEGMAQMDTAFKALSTADDTDTRHYDLVHQMIERVEIGLYRPYPDPHQRERVALI
jgi:hypothetical protein